MNTPATIGLAVALLVAVSAAAPVEVAVSAPKRLQTLERKASQYDVYRKRYMQIQQTLDEMLAMLGEDGKTPLVESGEGRLADLLERASRANTLAVENEQFRDKYERIKRSNEALQRKMDELRSEFEGSTERIKALEKESKAWKAKALGMRETIDRLLLGQFEYYEIKEGDTLQGIAANPMVYGDPARAVWLRQANRDRLTNPDQLVPGEVLVVPRFPQSGSYEF